MGGTDRIARAQELYEQAVFAADTAAPDAADRELDAVEAEVALVRGRLLHARFLQDREHRPREVELFQRALGILRRLEDVRGQADALFWIGAYHQVVRDDHGKAVPYFLESYELAESAGDTLTVSYATRHLAFAAADAGRTDEALARFEESVRLREELGFLPGVAGGKVALAQLLATTGDRDRALRELDDAERIARTCGARTVLDMVGRARAEL